MGVVRRALETNLVREVAFKALPDAFAADSDYLAWFEREAKLLASPNHPHIASVYGLHEHGGPVTRWSRTGYESSRSGIPMS